MGRSELSGDFLRRLYTPRHYEYGRAILTGFWGSGGAFEVLLVCLYHLGKSEAALPVCDTSSNPDAEVYEKVLEDRCPAGEVERNCLCNIGDMNACPSGAPHAANAFWYGRKYLLGGYVTTRVWLSQGLASVHGFRFAYSIVHPRRFRGLLRVAILKQPKSKTSAKRRRQDEEYEVSASGYVFLTEPEAESSGPDETEEEEEFEQILEREKAKQAVEEAKVKAASADLEQKPWKWQRIGDIRGKWNLYSTQWVEEYANKPGQELEDNDWMNPVGTIEFGKHLIDTAMHPDDVGVMGMELSIFGGPSHVQPTAFNKPKYASLNMQSVLLAEDGGENEVTVDINFLGDGYLELSMDEIYFARIMFQDRKAAKREAEEASLEWQDCKYTGHMHPGNNKRLKMYMAECGVLDDLDDYGGYGGYDSERLDSGSFDESEATGSEEEPQEVEDDEEEDEDEEDEEDEEPSEAEDVLDEQSEEEHSELQVTIQTHKRRAKRYEEQARKEQDAVLQAAIAYHTARAVRYETLVRGQKSTLFEWQSKNRKTPLAPMDGKWTLFSSQYLEFYEKQTIRELDEETIMNWSAGTLRIKQDGTYTEIIIKLLDASHEFSMVMNTPKFASPERLTGDLHGIEYTDPEGDPCWITCVGNGFLDLHIPGEILEESGHWPNKARPYTIRYVGVMR